MRGVFEPGTYPARDIERDEALELRFEPPRSLHGLDTVFTAHEVLPNDEVILTITDDGLELEVTKRPRRKVPQAKGEPWESVSGARTDAPERSEPKAHASRESAAEHDRGDRGRPPSFDSRAQDAHRERPAPDAGAGSEDASAPRMVRARRVPKPGGERPHEPRGSEDRPPERFDRERREADSPARRGTPQESAARRFFEDPGDPDDPYAADATPDDAWRWDRPEASEDPDAAGASRSQGGGFFARIAQAAKGALSFGSMERDDRDDDDPYDDDPREADAPREPYASAPDAPRRQAPSVGPKRPRGRDLEEETRRVPPRRDDPRNARGGGGGRDAPTGAARQHPQPAPAGPTPRDVAVEDASAMDLQGPPMWELGEGDLRSRLIRFLQHPDVPVIVRTDMIARNFGLGAEVADAMLEDLTNDKIDGLVVTKLRDETYRISRAPTKL